MECPDDKRINELQEEVVGSQFRDGQERDLRSEPESFDEDFAYAGFGQDLIPLNGFQRTSTSSTTNF